MADLILASASPRREQLLRLSGLSFNVVPALAVEEKATAASPELLAVKLALLKARQVSRRHPSLPVLGADTVVVIEDKILGKPVDPAAAEAMLGKLQGKCHRVITGVAVVRREPLKEETAYEETLVWMRPLSPGEIKAYAATGEPLDKAGAYGIQGRGGYLIEKIQGCYFNVVGLPLSLTMTLLGKFGLSIFKEIKDES
ncbi:MAG TPA: septum formation inhibitor Maf [Firmicutes bacterium]|nr:septum formation inhibitor Maf [Bacillota bacterium]